MSVFPCLSTMFYTQSLNPKCNATGKKALFCSNTCCKFMESNTASTNKASLIYPCRKDGLEVKNMPSFCVTTRLTIRCVASQSIIDHKMELSTRSLRVRIKITYFLYRWHGLLYQRNALERVRFSQAQG